MGCRNLISCGDLLSGQEPGIVCNKILLKSLLKYPDLQLAQNRYSAQTLKYLR
jgi:hypothetical protein